MNCQESLLVAIVDRSMAFGTQSNQISFNVFTQLTPALDVMDLQEL